MRETVITQISLSCNGTYQADHRHEYTYEKLNRSGTTSSIWMLNYTQNFNMKEKEQTTPTYTSIMSLYNSFYIGKIN